MDSFLLFVEIAIYAVVFVAIPFAVVSLLSRPPRWLSRIGAFVVVAAVAEAVYLLKAPACIYLPKAPGHRMAYWLLGVNAQHRLVLVARRESLGFLWGPRWYFVAGDAFDFGFEIVRPLRYQRDVQEDSATLVVGDRERPYPSLEAEATVLRPDGCVFGWTGGFRPELYRLDPEAVAWRLVAEMPFPYAPPPGGPVGPPYPPRLVAVNTTPAGGVIELYQEAEASREEGPSRLILLERAEDGREISRSPVALPRVHRAREGGRRFAVVRLAQESLVFESSEELLEGHGLTYSVSPNGGVQPISAYEFAADDNGSYPTTISPSADGAYFTTGQAVFRRDGTKVRDLHPTLGGCVWDGSILYGVRWYRFPFGYQVRRSAGAMEPMFEAAKRRAVEVDPEPSLDGRPAAWRHGEWFMNGIDQAGRDDEVVAVSLPLP